MKKAIKSAFGLEGQLIHLVGGNYALRVKDEAGGFKDYTLLHSDMTIRVEDPEAWLYESEESLLLDHAPETLGLEKPKLDMEASKAEFERLLALDASRVAYLLATEDMQDEDGYPTAAAIEVIERWAFGDKNGLFDFVAGIWWMPEFGWREERAPHAYREGRQVQRYMLSTGGWSGNESIIRAMENNKWFLWTTTWRESRAGGHYVFEIEDEESEVKVAVSAE